MYESLIDEIDQEGICVFEMKMKGNSKGYYSDDVIAINSSLETEAEKRCTLVEELGHLKFSSGNILNAKKISNIKQEKIARNWGYKKLVGITDIINAFNSGVRNRYELAEYLNVTEYFLNEAINHYKEKYGLYYEIDNYIVYFEPKFGVLKMF